MRLDGGKLKEIQVRLFLSSRAEMQEVIETARQTTMSLMQMQQRPPTIAAPTITAAAVLTPQSPPQVSLAAAIQKKIPPVLPAPLPGLITQQMYQQQLQSLHQQVFTHNLSIAFYLQSDNFSLIFLLFICCRIRLIL